MTTRLKMRRTFKLLTAGLFTVAATALAGCGSDSSPGARPYPSSVNTYDPYYYGDYAGYGRLRDRDQHDGDHGHDGNKHDGHDGHDHDGVADRPNHGDIDGPGTAQPAAARTSAGDHDGGGAARGGGGRAAGGGGHAVGGGAGAAPGPSGGGGGHAGGGGGGGGHGGK